MDTCDSENISENSENLETGGDETGEDDTSNPAVSNQTTCISLQFENRAGRGLTCRAGYQWGLGLHCHGSTNNMAYKGFVANKEVVDTE